MIAISYDVVSFEKPCYEPLKDNYRSPFHLFPQKLGSNCIMKHVVSHGLQSLPEASRYLELTSISPGRPTPPILFRNVAEA